MSSSTELLVKSGNHQLHPLEAPAKCPNGKRDILEKTLIEPA
jgi:hypothetical protein